MLLISYSMTLLPHYYCLVVYYVSVDQSLRPVLCELDDRIKSVDVLGHLRPDDIIAQIMFVID